jgi:hypothetical protein
MLVASIVGRGAAVKRTFVQIRGANLRTLHLVAKMKAPANKPLKLTAAGFCRAGGRARIGAW